MEYIWLLLLVLFIIATVVALILRKSILLIFYKTPKAKTQIPAYYQLDYLSRDLDIVITNFQVEVVESKLNLHNNESILSYTISVKSKDGLTNIHVTNVYLSDRIEIDNDGKRYRIFSIFPNCILGSDSATQPNFTFTNQVKIKSTNWGQNKIQFTCSEFRQEVVLQQMK